jgi:hypothetical protein
VQRPNATPICNTQFGGVLEGGVPRLCPDGRPSSSSTWVEQRQRTRSDYSLSLETMANWCGTVEELDYESWDFDRETLDGRFGGMDLDCEKQSIGSVEDSTWDSDSGGIPDVAVQHDLEVRERGVIVCLVLFCVLLGLVWAWLACLAGRYRERSGRVRGGG